MSYKVPSVSSKWMESSLDTTKCLLLSFRGSRLHGEGPLVPRSVSDCDVTSGSEEVLDSGEVA